MRRYLIILISVLACTLPLLGQQTKVLAPHRPIAPRLPDDPPKSGPLRSMVGGLWMIDANFKSTIYIKNDVEIAPVTVTPILYLSNGKKVTLADVTLEPSGTATVSVNDGLNANGISPWATLNGYVEVQYKWPWDPLCVTVTSVDTIHSVIFTNGLRPSQPMNPSAKALMAKGPGTQIIEGMWWKQESQVTGFVALSNTTAHAMNAQLQISDNTGQSIGQHALIISPHGTKTVNLQELQSVTGNAGGLRITYHGGLNDLLPNGGLEDQASGYSASVPFVLSEAPSSKGTTLSYAELGLMAGAADPMMQFPAGTTFTPYSLLRNVSGQPASVTPSIYWMEAGTPRSARLQAISLAAYEAKSLDVAALLSLAGLKNLNGSFNLVFDVQGSVLMASGSVDQTNTYVFEVMPTSVKESASKSIGYWSTKNGDDTMTTLWNPADEDQNLVFTLFFSGGHYDLPVHLDSKATRTFNISEIIQNQIPDQNGSLIPSDVHEGNARVSGTNAENEHILVALDSGIYNVQKATCHDTCNNCNGMVSSSFAIVPFGTAVSGHVQMSLTAKWNTGRQFDLTDNSTWGSNHTNFATVSTAGLVTGVATGQVIVNGADELEPWAGQVCGSPPPACPPDQGAEGSGNGTVFDVGVSGKSYILVGSDSAVVVANQFQMTNGAHNSAPQPPGGTCCAASSDSSDTVTQVPGDNPPSFQFQTPDQSTTAGDRTLTFEYDLSDGTGTSVQLNVTARKFAYLVLTNNPPPNQCSLGYGTDQQYIYSVYTHPDLQPIPPQIAEGAAVNETFNPTLTCSTITGNGSLNANAQVIDHISSACSSAPLTCTQTSTQSISVGGYAVRTNTLQWTNSGVTYTNDGPNQ